MLTLLAQPTREGSNIYRKVDGYYVASLPSGNKVRGSSAEVVGLKIEIARLNERIAALEAR